MPNKKPLKHSKPMTMAEYKAIKNPDPDTVYHICEDSTMPCSNCAKKQKQIDIAMATFTDICSSRFFAIDESTEVLLDEIEKTVKKAIVKMKNVEEE